MPNPRVAVLAVLLLEAPTIAAAQGAESRWARLERVDSLVHAYVSGGRVASLAIAVVQGRDTLRMNGYGLADGDAHRAAGPSTVYEIGSITKQFTAAAILRLVEQGKVGLEDDISKYVPTFPLHGHHITVHQLLNHTSGIHNYTNVRTWQQYWSVDLSPDSVLGFVKQDSLDFAPGTRHSYSNSGYMLLGMIIENASGKTYAQFLDENFFKPLKLTQTRYCPSHPNDTSFAAGYSYSVGQLVPSAYLSMTHPFAAGAICSTVRDQVVWQTALHRGQVLSPGSYAKMTTPDVLPNGTTLHYAFGLGIERMNGHRMIVHGGGINGFSTGTMYFPDDSLHVVVYTNTDAGVLGNPTLLAGTIARAVLGLPLGGRLFDRN